MSRILRIDPTRTTLIRRSFLAEMRKRMLKLKKVVIAYIENTLVPAPTAIAANNQFVFVSDYSKVEAFRTWLQQQINDGVLELPEGVDVSEAWTSRYVYSAYRSAKIRSYTQIKGQSLTAEAIAERAAFYEQAFNGPVAVSSLQRLYTRAFSNLNNITEAMDTQLSDILTRGLADGRGPRDIARQIAKSIDGITSRRALVLARTEVIHAYAEGQLDAFEQFGFNEVYLLAEWVTSGHNVCPLCGDREGRVYTIEEARGTIPLHPNCKCAWIPVVEAPKVWELRRYTSAAREAVENGRIGRRSTLSDAIRRSAKSFKS